MFNAVRCKQCYWVIKSKHSQDFDECKCGAVAVRGNCILGEEYDEIDELIYNRILNARIQTEVMRLREDRGYNISGVYYR